MECTYMEGSLPGVIAWFGKACSVVSRRLLNNTLNDTVLTTRYSEDLESVERARKVARGGRSNALQSR